MARSDWKIKPCIAFDYDKYDKLFFLIPTVMVQPWAYRYPNTYVVDIAWLHLHIGIGKWERK